MLTQVPMGWFVLLGVGLFGVLGWVIFQTNMGDSGDALIDVKAANQPVGQGLWNGLKGRMRGRMNARPRKLILTKWRRF